MIMLTHGPNLDILPTFFRGKNRRTTVIVLFSNAEAIRRKWHGGRRSMNISALSFTCSVVQTGFLPPARFWFQFRYGRKELANLDHQYAPT